MGWESGIPNPGSRKNVSRIPDPDPGIKKVLVPDLDPQHYLNVKPVFPQKRLGTVSEMSSKCKTTVGVKWNIFQIVPNSQNAS
jgi:hypothetical protein